MSVSGDGEREPIVQRQSRLGAVPLNELIHHVLVRTAGLGSTSDCSKTDFLVWSSSGRVGRSRWAFLRFFGFIGGGLRSRRLMFYARRRRWRVGLFSPAIGKSLATRQELSPVLVKQMQPVLSSATSFRPR